MRFCNHSITVGTRNMGICLSVVEYRDHSRSKLSNAAGGARPPNKDHPKRCLNMPTRWLLAPASLQQIEYTRSMNQGRVGNLTEEKH